MTGSLRRLLVGALVLAAALPAVALSVKLRKGSAVVLADRPAWQRRADLPAGAETAPVHEDPAGEGVLELWRVGPGWTWAPPPRPEGAAVVVLAGRLEARVGTLVKTLAPGGSAVFPPGTPFTLTGRTWLRRTVFLLVLPGGGHSVR